MNKFGSVTPMSIILTLKRMAGNNVSSYCFYIGVDIHSDSQTLIKSPNSLQAQLGTRGLAVRVLFVSRRGSPEAAQHYGQL